jgi:hypothetical protein
MKRNRQTLDLQSSLKVVRDLLYVFAGSKESNFWPSVLLFKHLDYSAVSLKAQTASCVQGWRAADAGNALFK